MYKSEKVRKHATWTAYREFHRRALTKARSRRARLVTNRISASDTLAKLQSMGRLERIKLGIDTGLNGSTSVGRPH